MEGLITLQSKYNVKETIDRVAEIVQSKGLSVFARIDHAANALDISLELRPTELIIFGNPKAGTILMADRQISGLDLPMRALAWEDENGKVWISYNDPEWIAMRYGLSEKTMPVIAAIAEGMNMVCGALTI